MENERKKPQGKENKKYRPDRKNGFLFGLGKFFSDFGCDGCGEEINNDDDELGRIRESMTSNQKNTKKNTSNHRTERVSRKVEVGVPPKKIGRVRKREMSEKAYYHYYLEQIRELELGDLRKQKKIEYMENCQLSMKRIFSDDTETAKYITMEQVEMTGLLRSRLGEEKVGEDSKEKVKKMMSNSELAEDLMTSKSMEDRILDLLYKSRRYDRLSNLARKKTKIFMTYHHELENLKRVIADLSIENNRLKEQIKGKE